MQQEKGGVPRVMIEHVADLNVHGPIGPYEHVARGALDHGIHHLQSPTKTIRNRNEISDSPMTINRTTGAIGEWFRPLSLFLSQKKTKIVSLVDSVEERFGWG